MHNLHESFTMLFPFIQLNSTNSGTLLSRDNCECEAYNTVHVFLLWVSLDINNQQHISFSRTSIYTCTYLPGRLPQLNWIAKWKLCLYKKCSKFWFNKKSILGTGYWLIFYSLNLFSCTSYFQLLIESLITIFIVIIYKWRLPCNVPEECLSVMWSNFAVRHGGYAFRKFISNKFNVLFHKYDVNTWSFTRHLSEIQFKCTDFTLTERCQGLSKIASSTV